MRKQKDHGFTALRIEGNILPPEFLQKVTKLSAPGQSNADYGISKSFNVKDMIGHYWRISVDLWSDYVARRDRQDLGASKVGVAEWLLPFLRDVLGYRDIDKAAPVTMRDREFRLSHRASEGAVPFLLATREFDLDKADGRFGDEGRKRPPHGMIQEFLNAEDDCLWGMVANGEKLRLLRDNPSLTRPAYVEADLERMFAEQLFADFAAFWLLFHESRTRPREGKVTACLLESWHNLAAEEGSRALGELRQGVTTALRQLGNGFLQKRDNQSLRDKIASGSLDRKEYFQELLRLVYRLLFLFKAEERGLLHAPDADEAATRIYQEGYALARLRDKARRKRHYDGHTDLWQGLRITFTGLAEGAAPLALPALGGLFDADQCPHLDAAEIDNAHLLEAIRAISFHAKGKALERINYRDMGTEELGSVYESLLELHPRIDVETAPWQFGFVGDDEDEKSGKGSDRKLTGSYYTPPSLVNELIKSALEPVLERTIRDNPTDPVGALLKLKVCDPACGSGHFLLAAARHMGAEIARLTADSDTPGEQQRQHALREVVRHCIYGVDKNPLSVELCKTALWIETLEPGRPLTFLDHRIKCGDSLVGATPAAIEAGIPDDAFKPVTGDDKKVCTALKKRNKEQRESKMGSLFRDDEIHPWERLGDLAAAMQNLDASPADSIEDIARQKKRYAEHVRSGGYLSGQFLADAWCAAFMNKKDDPFGAAITEEPFRRIQKNPHDVPHALKEKIRSLAGQYGFFHWHLEFPEVFRPPAKGEAVENETMGWRGGFDVLLGNPPWERIKLQEQEFFAARHPDIAKAKNASERQQRIRWLADGMLCKHLFPELDHSQEKCLGEQRLHAEFNEAKRMAEAVSVFVHLNGKEGGRFPLTGVGDVNTYALFAELFLNLQSTTGRAGVIVPTGIATDNSTKAYFEAVALGGRLASLIDFENSAPIFQGVHRSFKFALLTLGNDILETRFTFFATRAEHLLEKERQFTLTPEEIALINPNTKTCPVFRSRQDAELTKKIYRNVPVLIKESPNRKADENPWGIRFMRMLDMSNDSGLFRTAEQLTQMGAEREGVKWLDGDGTVWVPLYEPKMFSFYDHRASSYASRGDERGYRVLPDTSDEDHLDPNFSVQPFYWVNLSEVDNRIPDAWQREWLLGFKDITSPTNERTVIPTVIPKGAVGNKMPLLISENEDIPPKVYSGLIANISSIPFDFIARQKVGGVTLNYFYVKQFPVLPPSIYNQMDIEFIVPRVLELTYTAHDLKPFAEDLGYDGPPFRWDPDRRAILRAELDAYYARLYGLTRDELRYILDPANVMGADYPSETFRVLKNKEMREFGEYRTARLVLDAWDRLERGELEG
ncbi:putative type II DNA modification enzyme [Magnetococcus marinus MC-1]|uniref:site-specific DNA-methyltransferase (adenine-specific) n=1 Tax=Magnetococcus marinus (strain ATCC BAA-1437 / JCM 17883 / MC-1) TaxID=156889 RepID=A0L975_MAGMM|nr:N-6 DNA methylase [Magnetococcus marinus]ABK44518.1 putative type II DNA modification enzyme [Magnetococcus marinus MC-1]